MALDSTRQVLTSYLDDFLVRGEEMAFASFKGLRLKRWTYAEIARTAFQFARELDARGVNKADRVVLWAGNSPEWVAAFFGCLLRGVVAVPIDAVSEPRFVLSVQKQVNAKLALTSEPAADQIRDVLPLIDITNLRSQLERHPSTPYQTSEISADDLAEIIFTSGTTAEPKGVALTHRNMLANLNPLEKEIKRYLKWERLVHPVRFLNLVPLSHVFGQFMGMFVPPLIAGEVYFHESLLPSQIIKTVKRERISVIVSVPRILETMRDKIERDYEAREQVERFRRDLKSAKESHFITNWWRFRSVHQMFGWKFWAFVSGGATLNVDTEAFWQRLGFAVIQGYGMTETSAIISVNHPFKKARGSIGKVLPGQEVRLDENGEILVRGVNVASGYWNAEARAESADWFRTGDAGEMDAAGNLYFKGRKKEVIVTSAGMNIYPEDIEVVLDRQPEVRASVVVEIAGAHGPEPLAVLVLRDANANVATAIERANKFLEQHQQVRRWAVWPDADFPRTATLKVRKALVARRMIERLSTSSSPAPTGILENVVAKVAGELPERLDSSARLGNDLKLDSLGRVELLSALEDCYHVEFDEAAFSEATTLGEVEQLIRENKQDEVAPYPYPRWQQRWLFNLTRSLLFYFVVLPFTRVMARPVVRGKENLHGRHAPQVFVCNHVTLADQALIMCALPAKVRRRLAIAMDGELLRDMRYPPRDTSLFTRLLYQIEYFLVVLFFNVFSMPQKSGFRQSFAFAGELMDKGHSILIFPEGERTKHGHINPFRPGTGLLISQLDTTAVPLRLDGLWGLKQANRHFAKSGEVLLTIGKPISYSPDTQPQLIAEDLEKKVKGL